MLSRSLVCALAAAAALLPVAAHAAVDVTQEANRFDRAFERLPDLRLVRGAQPKAIPLVIEAEPDEAWSIQTTGAFFSLSKTSGTGPDRVLMTFEGGDLATRDDLVGALTIVGATDPDTNRETLAVRMDVWPNLSAANTPAELRAYAKDPANWSKDNFFNAWTLWGFLPDETTHGAGSGDKLDAWERTPCAAGTSGEDCVREGQAGLAAGMSADTAWLLSTGDPRTIVGILDSGIRWGTRSLVNKFYINAHELRGCAAPGADLDEVDDFIALDVDGDGVVSMRDWDQADFISDINGNGFRDPQDLIWGTNAEGAPCSDGIDDDANGYVDDISGWDFFWNDNDPSDDSDFGHGTGEAKLSAAEANDDDDEPSICPRCLALMVRVGDSFVVDSNQFADGAVFVVDSGAHVIQEALGAINHTAYSQSAIEYAYDNNVPIIASAADETSYHHNFPGALEHTMYVHAIVADTDGDFRNATTFQNFNNCTNFGGHLMLSTPGQGCSSEATGSTAGQTGLIMSYYRQLQDQTTGDLAAYYAHPFTTEEIYQTLVASADDIDVPGAEKDPEALALRKFPSNEGWDLHFGYGRNNVRRSLEVLRDQKIPPEADITSPTWFTTFDPARARSFEVTGNVRSRRLSNLRWSLFVAEGVIGKDFVEVASGTGAVNNGVLGTVSLAKDGPLAGLVTRAKAPAGEDPEQFSATLELRVTGTGPSGDVSGVFRKTFAVREDPDMHEGFPMFLGASGESSPKVTDLDGDGTEEIVVATADGRLHAIRVDGTELPGFPAATGAYQAFAPEICAVPNNPLCHLGSRAFRDGFIDPQQIHQAVNATIAVGDLDGDGAPGRDVVVATLDGALFVFDSSGEVKPGFPTFVDPSFTSEFPGALRCTENGVELIGCRSSQRFAERGFFAAPMLVDLDQDGSLEIVVGGLDQRAYAWHSNGELVTGWPVHLVNNSINPFDADGSVRRRDGRIVSSPTVANLFGDGTPIVLMGTNERVENSNGVFLYAIFPDGNAHPGGPFPIGWPAVPNGFIPDEILPFVGRGNPNSPVAGDLDGDGKDEVVNAGMGGLMLIFKEDGEARKAMGSTSTQYGPFANTEETASLPVINNPSIADLDGDGRMDLINGTAGIGLIQIANNGGLRSNFDHTVSAWIAENGFFVDGFPHKVHDYQFFMNYVVADLENSGKSNVISGDGGYFVYAPNSDGQEAPGFPKFTQGWHAATPAVGDLDGDLLTDVVANTREGWLFAWKTEGHIGGPEGSTLPAVQWASFHHDDQNTGNFGTPLKEYPRFSPPDDACGPGSCCCRATDAGGPRGNALPALAVLLGLGTLLSVGRRRTHNRSE